MACAPVLTFNVIREHHTADRQTIGKFDFKRVTFYPACHGTDQSEANKMVVGLG